MEAPNNFNLIKDFLEALSYVATIIGVPVAILIFRAEKKKERIQRERETYIEANARYIEYLTLCLKHPNLDCFEFSENDPSWKQSGLSIEKLTLFTILISLMETGYVLYSKHHNLAESKQWLGWHQYMVDWAKRDDFRKAWPLLGNQFDTEFVQHMEMIMKATQAAAQE